MCACSLESRCLVADLRCCGTTQAVSPPKLFATRPPTNLFMLHVHVTCSLLSFLRHPYISIHTLYMLSSIEHSFISPHSYFIFFLLFVAVIRLLHDSRFHTSSKPPLLSARGLPCKAIGTPTSLSIIYLFITARHHLFIYNRASPQLFLFFLRNWTGPA